MAKQFNYEVKTTIRLNMHNPDHVLINNVIQNLDPKIFKSKNQFILDACKFYIDNYGSETFIAKKKDNESQRFEATLSDSNGVLSDFDFGISGYSVDKNGNSITISSTSVNTTATTGTFTSNAGKVETTSSCVFWLTGKSGYQEFISERPTADRKSVV